jgi:hypothetical protein
MNLGPQKISTTYPYVINKSGSSFTLGDGGVINWADAEIVTTSGVVAQSIGGAKTFTSNITIPNQINFTSNGSITKAGNHSVTLTTNAVSNITFQNTATQTYTIPNVSGSSFVMTTGDQTIGGIKNFVNNAGFSGNVGIGNSNPAEKLDVISDGVISRFAGTTNEWQGIVIQQTQSSSTVNKGSFIDYRNENDIALANLALYLYSGGNSDFFISTTPSGSRSADRRVEALRIKGDGDVGIGTSSPISKLDVNGVLTINNAGYGATRLGGADNNGWLITKESTNNSFNIWEGGILGTPVANRLNISKGGLITTNGDINLNGPNRKLILYSGDANNNAYIQADSAGQVSIYNGTAGISNKFTVLSNGNIGIANESPSEKLDVSGIIKANNLYIENPVGDTSIEMGGTGNVYIDLKRPFSDDYDLRIQTNSSTGHIDTAANQDLIINGLFGRNVGIGTSFPTTKLDVSGMITASGLQLVRGEPLRWGANNENLDDGNISVTNTASDQTSMRFRLGDNADSNDSFIFERGNGAGGDGPDLVTIRTDGRVGIGTGSPGANLHIVGSNTVNSQVGVAAIIGSGLGSDVLIGSTGGSVPFIGSQGSSPLAMYTNANERIRIDSAGNIGINTSSPSARLDVSGSIKAQSFIIPNSGVKLNSNFTLTNSGQWYNILSGTLDAGNWLVNTSLMAYRNSTTVGTFYCRLSGNNQFYSSAQQFVSGGASGVVLINLNTIMSLGASSTVALQAAATLPGAIVMTGLSGASVYNGGHSTQIAALRIG